MSNYELIQRFLNIIKELAISNPSKTIDDNIIYTNLVGYNISKDQKPYEDISQILNNIANNYKQNPNMEIKKVKSFLVIGNGNINFNQIKLYLPLDKNHIETGIKELVDFISSKNIPYQIKISNKIRNDDISIKVNTLEDVEEILSFANNNEYIKEGLIKSNPFLPSIHGIGITMDNNYSYNFVISELIYNYIAVLKIKDKLDEIQIENLNLFINEQEKNIDDLDLKDIYNLLFKTTSKEFKIEDFIDHANKKMADKYDENKKRIVDPNYYLEMAVKKTYEKHHSSNIIMVLKRYIDGDAKYFTNDDNVRFGLIKYLEPRDLVNIMRNKLIENNEPVPSEIDNLINSYLGVILKDENYEKLQTISK